MSTSTRSSSAGSSGASSFKSSAFSETTKLRVKEKDGDQCWACGSTPVQICHVIAQEDQQAELWQEFGLLDFPLSSDINAISLCPTCHYQFNCSWDPGFIFIPTDLQFFIRFELEDRERRKISDKRGNILDREVPTSEIYKQYQVTSGVITPDAIGGQYRPTFLKSYLHNGRLPYDPVEYLSTPKEWHGAPLACLRRCFHLLGSPRLLDKQTRVELGQLRDLYFFDEGVDSPHLFNKLVTQTESENGGKKHSGRKRQHDDLIQSEPRSPKKQQGPQQGDCEVSYRQNETTFCPILQREVRAYWSLGPEVSTEEAVRRFAPLIARSLNSTIV